jgi:hypothetical protein
MSRKVRPEWYLTGIRKKKNETWTHEDRLKVYTLRVKENRPVKEVIGIFKRMGKKVNKTAIHNLTRQARGIILGKCYKCREDLTFEDLSSSRQGKILFLCKRCQKEIKKSKKKRRKEFLKNGLCGLCGKNPRIHDRTTCQSCLSITNRRRIQQGLCGTCGRHPIDKTRSIQQCSSCLEENILRLKKSAVLKKEGENHGGSTENKHIG